VLGVIYKRVLRRAGKVFVQNKMDMENLQKTTGVSAMAIANGCRLRESAEHQRDTILWAGRSAEIKRPMLFIDLAEHMPEEQFTMICQRATGDGNYEALVKRAEGIENLRFVRHVSFNEIDGYFERAKILVNTSEAEGFPNTFIQAGLCAVPIVSLNVNPDGFLDEYKCGICCDGDVERPVKELGLLLEGDKYIEMGRNARSYVEQNHDIKIIVGRYKELFSQITSRVVRGGVC
jgi:glycosyltransferase involved in cell wall biosynthesis